MKKIKKDRTLSFRIEEEIDKLVNEQIQNNPRIINKTDFGNKALESYFLYNDLVTRVRPLLRELFQDLSEKAEVTESEAYKRFLDYTENVNKGLFRA